MNDNLAKGFVSVSNGMKPRVDIANISGGQRSSSESRLPFQTPHHSK